MSDYSPFPVTSKDWIALPVAAEETMISVRGGAVLSTNHSNPTGENGHELSPGVTLRLPGGDAWKFRLSGAALATLYRTAVANTAAAPPETVIEADERAVMAGLSFCLDCAALIEAQPGAGFAATGLPAGLTLDPQTGTIAGQALAEGRYPLRVTATDGVGRKRTLALSLWVQALHYAADGGAATGLQNDDGSRSVTIAGGACAGSYRLSADAALRQDAGLPLILDFGVARTATGWQANAPVVLSAEDDAPVVRYEHRVGGVLVSTAETLDYAGVKDVETCAIVESLNTATRPLEARAVVAVQRAPLFAPVPMRFAPVKSSSLAADNPMLSWDTAGQPASMERITLMTSAVIGVPDGKGGWTNGPNDGGEFLAIGLETGWGETPRIRIGKGVIRALFNPSAKGILTYRDIAGGMAGDRIDALMSFGFERAGAPWAAVRIRRTPAAGAVPGEWLLSERSYPVGTTLDLAAARSFRIGGSYRAGAATVSRSALWLGKAVDPAQPGALAMFFDDAAPGGLAHPAIAAETMGQAQIDHHDGANHGSLGAPTCLNPALIA